MQQIFLTVLNMSVTAALAVLVVLLLRLALQKAPKVFSYALWAVVLFRLLCPVALESPISIFSAEQTIVDGIQSLHPISNGDTVPSTNVDEPNTSLSNGQISANNVLAPVAPSAAQVSNPLTSTASIPSVSQPAAPFSWVQAGTVAWLVGMAALAIYTAVSLLLLRRRLAESIPLGDKVWLAGRISTPFVLGLFRPKIYLPDCLPDHELDYVLLHERTHIRRFDQVIKALAWLALVIHWFNPLVWLAFHLAGKDMEMSCDEAVLRQMDRDVRADYSSSLLRLSCGKRLPVGPLAFGDGDPQSRIKNVLHYKKPAFWVVILAVAAVLTAGVALATDPLSSNAAQPRLPEQVSCTLGNDSLILQGFDAEQVVWLSDAPESVHATTAIPGWLIIDAPRFLNPYFEERAHISLTAQWSSEDKSCLDVTFVNHSDQADDYPEDFRVNVAEGTPIAWFGNIDPDRHQFRASEMVAMAQALAEVMRNAEDYYYSVVSPGSPEAAFPGTPVSIPFQTEGVSSVDWGIPPFIATLTLPQGWRVLDTPRDYEGPLSETATYYSSVLLIDGLDNIVGAMGWNPAPTYDEPQEEPMALFAGITMGHHFFDCSDSYREVSNNGDLLVAFVDVVHTYPANDGLPDRINRGILARSESVQVLLAIELDKNLVTEEQARLIAESLTIAPEEPIGDPPAPAEPDGSLPFDEPMDMMFAGGAGGWSTQLTLYPDGSFEGQFLDADMGDIGEGYPNGTVYLSDFYGRFDNINQVSEHAWSMSMADLVNRTGHQVGEEWIEDGVRYICTDPYGLEQGKMPYGTWNFVFYTPEATGTELFDTGDFWWWWPDRHEFSSSDTLGCYGLRNVGTNYGFFSLDGWGIE